MPDTALAPIGKSYAALGGLPALVLTYVVFLAVLSAAAALLRANVGRFALAFSAVFWLASIAWIIGSYAHFAAATPVDIAKTGVTWSLHLTPEGGLILALIAGLIVGNFFPRFADWLSEAIRPEFYVKIAIVILGGVIAITVAGKLNLASTVFLRSLAAIVEAYLIYWPVVYYISRNIFGFSREAAVPLASGISICGVAAAIATGSAIRARPQVAVLVSSLVVVFAVVELLILPFLANAFLAHEPLVAASWLGLAVKTDGAAVAAGGNRRVADQREERRCRHPLRAGLDPRHDDDDQGFHRCLHRHLGLRPRPYLDDLHQSRGRWAERPSSSKSGSVSPKFILGFILTFALGLIVALNPRKKPCVAAQSRR